MYYKEWCVSMHNTSNYIRNMYEQESGTLAYARLFNSSAVPVKKRSWKVVKVDPLGREDKSGAAWWRYPRLKLVVSCCIHWSGANSDPVEVKVRAWCKIRAFVVWFCQRREFRCKAMNNRNFGWSHFPSTNLVSWSFFFFSFGFWKILQLSRSLI